MLISFLLSDSRLSIKPSLSFTRFTGQFSVVSLTQLRVTWEEGAPVEELPQIGWPVGKSVRGCLERWLLWEASPLWKAPFLGSRYQAV